MSINHDLMHALAKAAADLADIEGNARDLIASIKTMPLQHKLWNVMHDPNTRFRRPQVALAVIADWLVALRPRRASGAAPGPLETNLAKLHDPTRVMQHIPTLEPDNA